MGISRAALLVLLALVVPVVVELRTALVWAGIHLTVLESIALGALFAAAIVAWAIWSGDDTNATEPTDESNSGPVR